jgi:hypothetical protein
MTGSPTVALSGVTVAEIKGSPDVRDGEANTVLVVFSDALAPDAGSTMRAINKIVQTRDPKENDLFIKERGSVIDIIVLFFYSPDPSAS